MSIPISTCLIRKALTDDKALVELQRRLKYNAKAGAMTIFKCTTHKPRCELVNEQEAEVLNRRLMAIDPDRKEMS